MGARCKACRCVGVAPGRVLRQIVNSAAGRGQPEPHPHAPPAAGAAADARAPALVLAQTD